MPQRDCSILVVDPSQSVLKTLRKVLAGAGFAVDTANNTPDALSLMLEGGYRLALIDAALHDRPTSEAIAQFKRLQPGLRILLIKKPFSSESLLSTVQESLKDR